MFFVILLVVLCNILHSDCDPMNDNRVKIKFPRPIAHASSVIINGTLNIKASELRAKITGRKPEKDDACILYINPPKNLINVANKSITYEFFQGSEDIVPFTFRITAVSNQDENTVSLHIELDVNEAGELALDSPCYFKSFSDVDRILFEGFKHIRSLTFLYKDEDGSDDFS